MFVDDLMLFCRTDASEFEELKECLATYEAWSGQKMNNGKTSMFESRNAIKERGEDLVDILSVKGTPDMLGVFGPQALFLKGRHVSSFENMVRKVVDRLCGWRSKALSWGRYATLIRFVL